LRTKQKFHTVYKKIIVSYVAVVLLSVFAVSVISHGYASSMLKEEMINSGVEAINRIGETLDRRVFERAERIWLQCAVNEPLFVKAFDERGSLSQYDYYSMCERLSEITIENTDIVSSINVYLGNSDIFISSGENRIIKFKAKKNNVIPLEFTAMVEEGKASGGWIVSDDGGTITFYRTIPYLEESEIPFRGYVAINIKSNIITDILSVEKEDKISFSVITKSGDYIYKTDNKTLDDETVSQISLSSDKNYYESSKGYIINSSKLVSQDLYIVRSMEEEIFFNRLHSMRIILWIVCILFAIVGFAVSIFYAKQIYNPIKQIVNNIQNFMKIEDNNRLNEYTIIDSTINILSGKVSDLESQVLKNHEEMRMKDIFSLLTGEKIKSDEILFKYNLFCTVVISILPYGESFTKSQRDVINILENDFNDMDIYYAINSANKIGAIVNFKNEEDIKVLTEKLKQLTDINNDEYSVVAAIGPLCDYNTIHVSYTDAVTTLRYKYLTEDRVLLSDEYLYRELSETKFSEQLPKKLIAELKSRDEQSIMAVIDELVEEIINSNCSYRECWSRISFIFSVYFSYILEENESFDYVITENTYTELNKCATVYEFREWFKNEVGEYILKANAKPQIETSNMMELAKKIIDNNLDKELSLNFVADRLYIAPAYLSRVFKNETGVTFNAYIIDKRLELARKLIIETNYSVNVISGKCGFNSATYLIKKFKSKYGQTPVNYKKNYIMKTMAGEKNEN